MFSLLHLVLALLVTHVAWCSNILMITMCGTKSHKIPFVELARSLTPRGHNITLISAFYSDAEISGLNEIAPSRLVSFVKNFTDWDLVGRRMRGEDPVHPLDVIRFAYESCNNLLNDESIKDFLESGISFDLLMLDGVYPECALGLVHRFKVPFMYINTVGFYTGSMSMAGNPTPYAFTPFLTLPFTDSMNLLQRTVNTMAYFFIETVHALTMKFVLQGLLRKHFGNDMAPIYDISKNVSFILQNGDAALSYPRPYLPNVVEVACIHCRPAKRLPKDLEDFIDAGGPAGFIYVSMGSSVRAANMPEHLRKLFIRVFRQLPQQVLWKWESEEDMLDLPNNVKLSRWLPQQDLLGHPKLRAFVTHGGLLSMFETVYHGVPIVSLPVFFDHDGNAAKAELDGYAVKLDLRTLTSNTLLQAIRKINLDPKFKEAVKRRQHLLLDQKETPLERSIYWTEYVIRHKGALHLQSPAKDLNFLQYYLVDVIALVLISLGVLLYLLILVLGFVSNVCRFANATFFKKSVKVE